MKSKDSLGKTRDRLAGRKTLKVNNLLDEFEKDDIKKHINIIELFKHFNVKPTKKGKNYIALCPWHNDKTPSLSIDKEKGLYNCFGCGESGDAFTLVQKMKGCDFKEALNFLKEYKSLPITKLETVKEEVKNSNEEQTQENKQALNNDKKEKKKESKENKEETETNESGCITLTEVCDYYHKKLFENEKAIKYLEQRNIKNRANLARFKVGFCDGTLINKISNSQEKYLERKGVLRESGVEHFKNFLTFPIFDENEQVVGIYGRNINDNSTLKHFYLKGNHKGIFNHKASIVYDEIILTESIIDALSLIETGINNVQAIYGTNGFTNVHLKTLKENRVKQVILAFDNDEAGQKASEELKDNLVKEDFEVKLIFPESKDWNDDLKNNLTKENINEKIQKAVSFTNPFKQQFSNVKKENENYIFETNELIYRTSGVKELFVNNLRVNLKAQLKENENERYYDNLDLYSARSRTSYATNLSKQFMLEPNRVEKDLINILEYLEDLRDKSLNRADENTQIVLTEEEKEIGMQFLTSENMFEQIIDDTEILGYVGETVNKLLMYIAASSIKLNDPISILITSQSSAGKSLLVDTIEKLIPPEYVIKATSLSDQALNYAGDLLHKFLVLSEAVHKDVVEHQLREMVSAKQLTRIVTVKDNKTGSLVSKFVKVDAIVSTVMSTTSRRVNPENASRCFVIEADESTEQTKRIHQSQRKKHTLERHKEKQEVVPEIIKKHHAAQRLLKKITVVNNIAHAMEFPAALMRTRRDHDRFMDLMASICYLRQYQKEIQIKGSIEYIECDLADYQVAYKILVNGVLKASLIEIPKAAVALYEEMRKLARTEAKERNLKPKEISLTQREIREKTGFGQSWVKQNLRILVEYEYIIVISGGASRSKGFYRLREDEPIEDCNLSMIPTPEELKQKLN